MSSSERILGHLPPSPVVAPVAPQEPPRHVLRGRAERRAHAHAGPIATGERGGAGGRGSDPSGRVAGGSQALPGLTAEAALDIQAVRRIAEERGYAAGLARAEQELAAAIDAAAGLAATLEALAPRETTTVAHMIVEVALAVSRRVVQAEVALDPTVLVSAIEGAVSLVNGSPEIRIFLDPMAVDAVREAWESRHGKSHLGKQWTFEADPTLPAGGCVLRHEHGFVDAGLEAQLEEIGIALDRVIPNLLRSETQEPPP